MIGGACMKKPAVVRPLYDPLGSCDRSCVWWLEVPVWKSQQVWSKQCLIIGAACKQKVSCCLTCMIPYPLDSCDWCWCLMIGGACIKKLAAVWPIWYPSPSTVVFKAVYDDWKCLYEKASCCQTYMIRFSFDSCIQSCVWWLKVPERKSQLLSDFCQTHPLESCYRSCVWWFEVLVWKSQLLSDLNDTLILRRQLYSKLCRWFEVPVFKTQAVVWPLW